MTGLRARTGVLTATILLGLTACGSGGSASTAKPLTLAQLKTALLTTADLKLPTGFTAGTPDSGTVAADTSGDGDLNCPGVGTVKGNTGVGDAMADITFNGPANSTLEEHLETGASSAAALKDLTDGTTVLDKCKSVSVDGAMLTVSKAAVSDGDCDHSAGYNFTGTLQNTALALSIRFCLIGSTEISIDTTSIGGGPATSLAAPALTAASAKVKKGLTAFALLPSSRRVRRTAPRRTSSSWPRTPTGRNRRRCPVGGRRRCVVLRLVAGPAGPGWVVVSLWLGVAVVEGVGGCLRRRGARVAGTLALLVG